MGFASHEETLANLFPDPKLEVGTQIRTARQIVAEIVGKLHQFYDPDERELVAPTPARNYACMEGSV